MTFRPGDIVFVDESKAHAYYLVAVAIDPFLIGATEKQLKQLRRGGRSVIHFKNEGSNRDRLARAFIQMEVQATVYSVRGASDRVARPLLLRRLVDDITKAHCSSLVIERDLSVETHDRQTIGDRLNELGATRSMTFRHGASPEYPILWIADAIAWCHQKGGHWKTKVQPIVCNEVHIAP